MIDSCRPFHSLQAGRWFKLICGASFQHLPAIRSLALVYGLAGADCLDVAADPAVVAAARSGLAAARSLAPGQDLPWLMVSLNDGEDPHFRKAEFVADRCPADCPRPCERVCPTGAILFPDPKFSDPKFPSLAQSGLVQSGGVQTDLCYGCGRCLPVCPLGLIEARSHQVAAESIVSLVLGDRVPADRPQPDPVVALEIHTQPGRSAEFGRLWQAIAPLIQRGDSGLKLIAVSCPDGEGLLAYLQSIAALIGPDLARSGLALVWQTDGRPMSGDIGGGTTHAAIDLGAKVQAAGLPGFVQLAGGTNDRTVAYLRDRDRAIGLGPGAIAGVAYGGYGRKLLEPVLSELAERELALGQTLTLESQADLLARAIDLARGLIDPLKIADQPGFNVGDGDRPHLDRPHLDQPQPEIQELDRPNRDLQMAGPAPPGPRPASRASPGDRSAQPP